MYLFFLKTCWNHARIFRYPTNIFWIWHFPYSYRTSVGAQCVSNTDTPFKSRVQVCPNLASDFTFLSQAKMLMHHYTNCNLTRLALRSVSISEIRFRTNKYLWLEPKHISTSHSFCLRDSLSEGLSHLLRL